jgi:hypothetical protein
MLGTSSLTSPKRQPQAQNPRASRNPPSYRRSLSWACTPPVALLTEVTTLLFLLMFWQGGTGPPLWDAVGRASTRRFEWR